MKMAPHFISWSAIPVLVIICLVAGPHKTVDLQFHDTYYVINLHTYCFVFAMLLGLFGFMYWILRNLDLPYLLARTHIQFTTFVFIAALIYLGYVTNNDQTPAVIQLTLATFWGLLLFLIFQLIFLFVLIFKILDKT